MNIECGKTYVVSFFNRIEYHKFYYVTEISSTGMTFKCRELESIKTYNNHPYNTTGTMVSGTKFSSNEVLSGRFTKKGSPYISNQGEKEFIHEYNGESLSFDFND